MNINITSRKFKAKDSLKTHIERKIKSLEKYNDQIMEANVVLSYTHNENSIKNVEIVLHIPGKVITIEESDEDYVKAVNSAVDRLERQVKRVKEKKITAK